FEVVALVEHDRVDLLGGNELDDVDLATALLRERLEFGIRQDHRALTVVVRLVDVLVVDDLAAHLTPTLVADAPAILVVHLVQRDVVVLGRAVDLHRHVDQSEGDGALPDGSHASIIVLNPVICPPFRGNMEPWPRRSSTSTSTGTA